VTVPPPLRRLAKNGGALLGLSLIVLLVVFAAFGPLLSAHDAWTSDFEHGISDHDTPVGPNLHFLLGADRIFRDQLVRLAHGARLSLFVALAATLIASVVGGFVGIVAGYHESRLIDVALMRVVDVGLAFPFLLLVMAIGSALGQTTPTTLLLVLGLTGWLGAARIVRARTIQVKHAGFVDASRALGQPVWRILLLHILPNVSGPIIVLATLSVAQMIVAESVLSYLGAGVAPPTPTWGHMLFEGQDYVLVAPWTLLAPGAAILLAVLGFNLMGEGLRDALDPQSRIREG
jgi:ABC-type dipeptide/oligopeptide/nickel transport system permease subunit